MNNWTFFFLTVGIVTSTAQLFRLIDWIEGVKK